MLIIEYVNNKNGRTFADYEAMSRAKQVVENLRKTNRLVDGADDYTLSVSSENIVYAFRVLVAKGEIDCSQIKFTFEGRNITVGKFGRLSDYPRGFCDTFDNFLTELLAVQIDYEKERKN